MKAACCCVLSFVIVSGCWDHTSNQDIAITNIPDTIKRTVRVFDGYDTILEHQVITYTANDASFYIDTAYYYDVAWAPEYNAASDYRLYFDRQSILLFCDSMLTDIGPENGTNYNLWSMCRAIRNHALGVPRSSIGLSETHYLMNRFKPLIMNPHTKHRPFYYFKVHLKSSDREDIERRFVAANGDTLGLSWENLWIKLKPVE